MGCLCSERKHTQIKRNKMSTKKDRIEDSIELFEDFTGHEADSMDSVSFDMPDVAMEIGTVDGIMYTTIRDGEKEKYNALV